jgi:hypothetical protein
MAFKSLRFCFLCLEFWSLEIVSTNFIGSGVLRISNLCSPIYSKDIVCEHDPEDQIFQEQI